MSAADILAREGIRCSSAVGDHHTTCPQCSARRKKKHQRCLSVTVKADGVVWFCHHCHWSGSSGGAANERQRPTKPAITYGDLQRRVLASWRR